MDISQSGNWILHICKRAEWQAAQQIGEYRALSLDTEGFIHCSRLDQVAAAANQFFSGAEDLVVLWIDPEEIKAELRWDPVGGEVYPHIYGPLNLEAVKVVDSYAPDADGIFHPPS